jgi:hypothetical protein
VADDVIKATQRSKEWLCNGSAFLAHHHYLWRSKTRNVVAKGMIRFLVIAVVVVIGWAWRTQQEAERAKLTAQTAAMWGIFSSWAPVMTSTQVENLWKLATNTEEYRSAFVDQLENISDITAIGFRPQPVLRAVGLRWPEQRRQVGLKALLENVRESQNEWNIAALACVLGALDDRIDEKSKALASEALSKYVRKLLDGNVPAIKLWPFTRMIACAGDELKKSNNYSFALFADLTMG